MGLLSGWKEIADHLHLGVRTAQRWEQFGLPVRRVSKSTCSPVIAMSDELEQWAQRRLKKANGSSLQSNATKLLATQRKTQQLVRHLNSLGEEHQRLIRVLQGHFGIADAGCDFERRVRISRKGTNGKANNP